MKIKEWLLLKVYPSIITKCGRCGNKHASNLNCPVMGQTCTRCNGKSMQNEVTVTMAVFDSDHK